MSTISISYQEKWLCTISLAQCNLKPSFQTCSFCPLSLLSSDLNECLNQTACGRGRCVNTEGSYRCNCFQGYELSPDNICQGSCQSGGGAQTDIINVSYQSNGSVNTPPQSYCRSLAAPFAVYEKGATRSLWFSLFFRATPPPHFFCLCIRPPDVDECVLPGVCLHGRCVNLEGTHKCTCNHGYQGTSDGRNCEGLQRIRVGSLWV